MINENEALRTEVIKDFNNDVVAKIVSLEPLFPNKVRYNEGIIAEYLQAPNFIHMFLKRGNEVIGYLFSLPHDYVVNELKNDDPLMRKDSGRYYIDQVAVIPEERKGLAFLHLGYALLDELSTRGLNRVSSHVLATNGLHKIIGRIFNNMITERRFVYLPRYGDDLFEYMEVTYTPR